MSGKWNLKLVIVRHPHPPYSFSCFDIRWCTTIPSAKATKRAPLSFQVESVQRFHETNSLCREHCLHAALTVAPLIKEAESCRWGCYGDSRGGFWEEAFQTSKGKSAADVLLSRSVDCDPSRGRFIDDNLASSLDLLESSFFLQEHRLLVCS